MYVYLSAIYMYINGDCNIYADLYTACVIVLSIKEIASRDGTVWVRDQ